MSTEFLFIAGFIMFIGLMMAIDLGLFGKASKPVSLKQAAIMSGVWVTLAMAFYVLILYYGHLLHDVNTLRRLHEINDKHFHRLAIDNHNLITSLQAYRKTLGLEFLTGYVVEYALSVDNIFVMVLIFTAFGVAPKNYHTVLLWGIIGAIVMRFLFIFLGAALIERFHWILYVFGAFLVYTGISMFVNRNKEEKIDPENHRVVKFAARFFAVHPHFEGNKFFVTVDGKKMITPLFLVLLIIETTDLIFAVDSIPAIFSITKDPYIVFFSNIFAILGLRSMFFLLVNIIEKFHYLKVGLAALLAFIGLKMLSSHYAEQIGLTTGTSLIIILSILTISVVASLVFPKRNWYKLILLFLPLTFSLMENTNTQQIPSLYEWAGGMPAFEKLFAQFYDKVLADDILEPVFKHMSPEHRLHVAQFVAEVLGGPKQYSDAGGSHFKMIQKHLSRHLTEQHRKRWVELLLQTADELELPDDPEFRSAFVAYLEWGTRIAVINSNTDEIDSPPDIPMPKWGWGVPGGPYQG